MADIARATSSEERTGVMSVFMAIRQLGLLLGKEGMDGWGSGSQGYSSMFSLLWLILDHLVHSEISLSDHLNNDHLTMKISQQQCPN